jgi:hypothetical protein
MPAKKIKPMEDVPKSVSARLQEIRERLAKEEAAKKVKRNPDGSRKRPGKPKPTAGKGMHKNIITKGGKAGLALENKMRSEMGIPKLKTTGKRKSDATEKKHGTPSRKISKQNDTFVKRYAKDAKKSGSTLKGNPELAKSVAPKSVSPRQKTVPVKPRGGRGLRGGMGFGGGSGLRNNVNK